MPAPTTTAIYVDRDQLRAAMLTAGFSDFNVLAARCGITRVSLSRYVNKVYPLSESMESKLRELLGAKPTGKVRWLTTDPAK